MHLLLRFLYRGAVRRPGLTLLAVATVVLAAAAGLPRLNLRMDGRVLAPAAAAEVKADREVRRRFDLRDPLVVLVESEHPDGIWNVGTLGRVAELTRRLIALPGVTPADVMSLATEPGLHYLPGQLTPAALIEPVPGTREELARRREELARIGLYDGVLLSRDGLSTALFVGVGPEADRLELYRRVWREAAAVLASPGQSELAGVLGAPAAEVLLGRHILDDLGLPGVRPIRREESGEHRSGIGGRIGMVPLALAVMALIFLAGFRRPLAALLPLAEVGCCLVVVFGVMGWLGVPLYLTTVVMPVILTAVGVADEIHILGSYARQGSGSTRREQVEIAVERMAVPVLHTSVTTALGFLSFAISPIGPVRAFGLFTAFGVLICLVLSFTAMPAMLVLVPRSWLVAPRPASGRGQVETALAGLGRWVARRRRAVLLVTLVLLLVCGDGIRRLEVQDSWEDGFDPASSFARNSRRFDEQFLGAHALVLEVAAEGLAWRGEIAAEALEAFAVTLPAGVGVPPLPPERLVDSRITVATLPQQVEAGPPRRWLTWIEGARSTGAADGTVRLTLPRQEGSPGFWLRPRPGERLGVEIHRQPLMQPANLVLIAELEAFLSERPEVGGVFGPARYLETVAFMTAPNEPGSRSLPASLPRGEQLWSYYARARGPERLHRLVSPDFSRALVTAYLPGANHASTRRLMAAVRTLEARRLIPVGLHITFAGDVAVSQAIIDGVVRTQLTSLGLSLLAIAGVLFLLLSPGAAVRGGGGGRSLLRGFDGVIPPLVAVVVNFALMGWLGIPLGVATSMFAGMTVGVGVDYAIHLGEQYRRALEAGLAGPDALAGALAVGGGAIVLDALAVALGFAVLLASSVPANARLGGLLVLSVVNCLVATLVVMPALWAQRRKGPESQAFIGVITE